MSADPQEEQQGTPQPKSVNEPGSFAEELGISGIYEPIVLGRGKLFSAAGPNSPIAEFDKNFLVMHPPQKPYEAGGSEEDVLIRIDDTGVLLNELGERKHVPGAKFNGNSVWVLGERKQGTLKHYAGWFDEEGRPHKLLVNGKPITTDIVYRLRNKTHDGELNIFPDLMSEE